ncbi:MAG TPA: hypothetical protein VFD58_36420 [Blastocatellia bacterium]|nr:hypothetical protein [Blastocatellia bacterium]
MSVRNNRSRERGEGRLGFLFALFVVVAVGYFVAKSAPLYIHKVQFQDEVSEAVRMAVLRNLSEGDVRSRLTTKAFELEIPRDAKIEVKRAGKTVTARVTYTQDITLPFYTYNWPVDIQAKETGF